MRCQYCGAELAEGVLFCRECGSKVEYRKTRFCRECGAELNEGARFCGQCGSSVDFMIKANVASLDASADTNAHTQDRLTVLEEKLAERERKLAERERKRAEQERKRAAWGLKQQTRNSKKNTGAAPETLDQTVSESQDEGEAALSQTGKQTGGLLGGLVSGAKAKLDERREEAKAAADQKSREQDEGWAYQLRLRYEVKDSLSYARSLVTHVCDRDGNDLYKVQAGLLSPKRRTIIKDMNNDNVATLKVVRFKGIGVEAAIDVTFGEEHVGRVLKREPILLKHSTSIYLYPYCFEPLGMRLVYTGGFKNFRYEITSDDYRELMAVAYQYGLFDTYRYKINFNDQDKALYFLVLLIAMLEIYDKDWER